MKIKKILIITLLMLLLSGCNNKPYKIVKDEKNTNQIEQTENKKESVFHTSLYNDLDTILINNKKDIEISKNLNGTDMSHMLLIDYSENKYVKLNEIIDKNKTTMIFISSPYCGACANINYTELINLGNTSNVLIAIQKDSEDETFIKENGLKSNLYVVDYDMIIDTFIENKTLEENYIKLTSLGLPSCIYLNSNMEFEFGVSGEKVSSSILGYLDYLK